MAEDFKLAKGKKIITKIKLKSSTKVEPCLLPLRYRNINNTSNITQNKIQEYQINHRIHRTDYICEIKQKKVRGLCVTVSFLDLRNTTASRRIEVPVRINIS